jgi:membrane protein YqaA with SNARE-associated domain
MGVKAIAALWGFAEATLFFIVPDVWLSIAGRKKLAVGLIACFYSLAGALTGGVILYWWGSCDMEHAVRVIATIPAVSSRMIARVNAELHERGMLAILLAPLSGTPYKVYTIQAAASGIGFGAFVLISVFARLIRFMLVTVFCHYILKLTARLGVAAHGLVVLLAGWGVFYIFYFYCMSCR